MSELTDFIADEVAIPVSAAVQLLVAAVAAKRGVAGIVFYGSGLWQATEDTVYDFYVLVDRFQDIDGRPVMAALGGIFPPNVYFLEIEDEGRILRCKYAVMRLDQFARAARGLALTPQIWARFAQPCRIAFARDGQSRDTIIAALTQASLTFHRHALRFSERDAPPREIWLAGLQATYAAELRSEQAGRGAVLYDTAPESFTRRTELALPLLPAIPRRPQNRMKILLQKCLVFLRLMKATFTFDGAVDYVLWKIERQSGVRLTATDFQRRHPLLGAWPLLWQAYRRGGFR